MTQTILHLDSSGQYEQSLSRKVTASVVDAIKQQVKENNHNSNTTYRDLAQHLPLINGNWMNANFTPIDEQTEQQQNTLSLSNQLIQELNDADHLVIGVPVYNFNIPVALKAWVDLVARAKVTFHYTENGPEGLVTPKKVYLVYASGGTPMGASYDYATPYLKHVLGFMGMHDITLIDAKTFESSAFNETLNTP